MSPTLVIFIRLGKLSLPILWIIFIRFFIIVPDEDCRITWVYTFVASITSLIIIAFVATGLYWAITGKVP